MLVFEFNTLFDTDKNLSCTHLREHDFLPLQATLEALLDPAVSTSFCFHSNSLCLVHGQMWHLVQSAPSLQPLLLTKYLQENWQ